MLSKVLKERRSALGFTLLEIANKMGVSEATVQRWESGNIKSLRYDRLTKLADILKVHPMDLIADNVETITPPGLQPLPPMKRVPRLGRIACGTPILADENIEGSDDVPAAIDCDFTLICEGDSMIGARINDGDIVYVKIQEQVENGEIAAVRIGDETTLKRFYLHGDTVSLVAENPRFAPLVFVREQLNDLHVIGKAVAFTSIIK